MLTGNNGILTQAQRAKIEMEKSQVEEENLLNNYENFVNNSALDTAVVGEIVTDKNKQYSNNGTAIIPVGFAIVPGLDNVEEGLVISDKENDTDNEGNQFVCIPVTSEEEYVRNITFFNEDVSEKAYKDIGYLPEGIQPNIPENVTDEKEIGQLNEQGEKQAILKSGGFYVSRFEAGKEGESSLVSKKGATVLNEISQEDCKKNS